MGSINKIDYNVLGVHINEISSVPELYNIDDKNFDLNVKLGVNVESVDTNKFVLNPKISVIQNNNRINFIDIACVVEINKNDWQLLISNHVVTIPGKFIQHLFLFIFYIANGALLLKNIDNVLSNLVLFTQDFSFIEEDYVFDFGKEQKQ
jgi:hypothetical protein